MRVLKKVDYSDWRCCLRCSRCTSDLEVEPSDVRAQYNGPRESSPAYYTYYCTCAVCQQKLLIAKDNVPAAMQHFLQEKTRHSYPSLSQKD